MLFRHGGQKAKLDSFSDPDAGQQRRDDAVAGVGKSNKEFVMAGIEAARRVAKRMTTFTADDLWMDLYLNGVQPPVEPRALGAVMTAVEREHIGEPTRDFKLSVRPACHRRPLRVWKSLIWVSKWK